MHISKILKLTSHPIALEQRSHIKRDPKYQTLANVVLAAEVVIKKATVEISVKE